MEESEKYNFTRYEIRIRRREKIEVNQGTAKVGKTYTVTEVLDTEDVFVQGVCGLGIQVDE